MPYCENCGSQINPNAKFFCSCGAPRNLPSTNSTQVKIQPAIATGQAKHQPINYYYAHPNKRLRNAASYR